MTDTSPLVKIKAALGDLKSEIKAMELRIGVVGHTIMQSKIRWGVLVRFPGAVVPLDLGRCFASTSRHKPANQKSGGQNGDDSAEFDIVGDGDEESEY
jgi:hypothetical protein